MTHASRHPDEPEEKPSWLVPLILLGITAVIAAIFLVIFLAPDVDEVIGISATPTSDAEAVQVVLGGHALAIPTNYIHETAARSGGTMDTIQLDALLPDLRGFGESDAQTIRDVGRLSPVVAITLKAGAPELNERDRFDRIYARHASKSKQPYTYAGFTVTPLTSESGYAGQSAFTREQDGDLAVLLCSADDRDTDIGGLCQRELALGGDMTLIYAFRVGHLENWPDLDKAVKALITRFQPQAG